MIAPPGLSETAQRGGHIPGAANVPWATARERGRDVQDRRRPVPALRRQGGVGPGGRSPTAGIGERSSHTWFVLKYLLGFTT